MNAMMHSNELLIKKTNLRRGIEKFSLHRSFIVLIEERHSTSINSVTFINFTQGLPLLQYLKWGIIISTFVEKDNNGNTEKKTMKT